MTVELAKPSKGSVALHLTDRASFKKLAAALDPQARRWLQTLNFSGAPDTHALVPAADGSLAAVWAGVRDATHPFALSALPKALPPGRYHLVEPGLALDPAAAALSWELGSYTFDLYKPAAREAAQL